MSEFKPTYQIYYYDAAGDYTKFKETIIKDEAFEFLDEAKANKLNQAHIQLSFKKGGSVPPALSNVLRPVMPNFETGGEVYMDKSISERISLAEVINGE